MPTYREVQDALQQSDLPDAVVYVSSDLSGSVGEERRALIRALNAESRYKAEDADDDAGDWELSPEDAALADEALRVPQEHWADQILAELRQEHVERDQVEMLSIEELRRMEQASDQEDRL